MARAPRTEPGEVVFSGFTQLAGGSNFAPERNEYTNNGTREAHLTSPTGWQYRILRARTPETPAQTSFCTLDSTRGDCIVFLDDGEGIEVRNNTGGGADVGRVVLIRV